MWERVNIIITSTFSTRRSVTPEPYRTSETRGTPETYSIPPHHPGHHALLSQPLSSRQHVRTPPPHHPPPPRYPTIDYSSHHDRPLNLSITNNNSNNSAEHSPSQARPSVITCANTSSVSNGRYETGGSGSSSPSSREVSSGKSWGIFPPPSESLKVRIV